MYQNKSLSPKMNCDVECRLIPTVMVLNEVITSQLNRSNIKHFFIFWEQNSTVRVS